MTSQGDRRRLACLPRNDRTPSLFEVLATRNATKNMPPKGYRTPCAALERDGEAAGMASQGYRTPVLCIDRNVNKYDIPGLSRSCVL